MRIPPRKGLGGLSAVALPLAATGAEGVRVQVQAQLGLLPAAAAASPFMYGAVVLFLTGFFAWIMSLTKKTYKAFFIRDYRAVGKLMRLVGGDLFPTFELKIRVHNVAESVAPIGGGWIAAKAPGSSRETNLSKKGVWEEVVKMTIHQGSKKIKFDLHTKTAFGRRKMQGNATIDIHKEILQNGFPQKHPVEFYSNGKRAATILFSFEPTKELKEFPCTHGPKVGALTNGDSSKNSIHANLMGQVKSHMKAKSSVASRMSESDFPTERTGLLAAESTTEVDDTDGATSCAESMVLTGNPEVQKERSAFETRMNALESLGAVCSGPVKMNSWLGALKQQFFSVESQGLDWFVAWRDKESDIKPRKQVPMESIKKIVASGREGEFMIVFEAVGAKEAQLICQSLDRDRDMWVHGLSLFKKEHSKFKQHLRMLKKTDRRFVKELKRTSRAARSSTPPGARHRSESVRRTESRRMSGSSAGRSSMVLDMRASMSRASSVMSSRLSRSVSRLGLSLPSEAETDTDYESSRRAKRRPRSNSISRRLNDAERRDRERQNRRASDASSMRASTVDGTPRRPRSATADDARTPGATDIV